MADDPFVFSRFLTPADQTVLADLRQWRWIGTLFPDGPAPIRHPRHERWMNVPGNVYSPAHREVMLTFRGSAVHSLQKQVYKREPGTVMLFEAGQSRDLKGAAHKKDFHCLWLHFSGRESLTFNSNSCDHRGRYFQEIPATVRSGPAVLRITRAWDQCAADPQAHLCRELLRSQLATLLLEILGSACQQPLPGQHAEVVALIEGYIARHLAGDLSLHSLARVAGYSPYFFHRLFTRATGRTPGAYVQALRLEQACERLRGGYRVGAAAEAVGFESLSYFNRFFKEKTGLTPGAWARQAR